MGNAMDKEQKDFQRLSNGAATEKVRTLLKEFKSAMLITTAAGGEMHVRPMGMIGKPGEFTGTLWFFTDVRSRKVREAQLHQTASLLFQNDAASSYLHLHGRVSTVVDRARMEQLYTPMLKTWFPDGLDDPNVTLLRFDADRGEFWDSPGGMLQVLAAFTKAVVTRTPGSTGEAGSLTL